VPILFWRKGMTAAEREQPIETVDIMPTLAAMTGVSVDPGTIDGTCLADVPGVACPAALKD
jgi:arylsulfatase A-like enzyme